MHIPSGSADRFAQRWARVRPGRPVQRPHTVRFGETIGDLAREHGVTEASLRELNELGDANVGAGRHRTFRGAEALRRKTTPSRHTPFP